MSYCFHISVCLFIVILQTTVMPNLSLLNRFYDLLIPFLIYLSVSRPVRESLPFVFFLGFIMDSLSGAPFGLYLTTYFWFFLGVKVVTKLLRVGDRLFVIMLIIVAGVLVENIIFLGAYAAFGPDRELADDAVKIVAFQIVWATCTGPFFFLIFKNMQSRLETGLKALYAGKSDN